MRITKTPKESLTIMEELILPNDTNMIHTLFGGKLMLWIDTVAAMTAMKHARTEVTTASIDSVDFLNPAKLGEMIKLTGKVTYSGKTSMEVKVIAECENPTTGKVVLTNEAYTTMVAIDTEGRPVEIPKIVPETEEEKDEYEKAKIRREARLQRRIERQKF